LYTFCNGHFCFFQLHQLTEALAKYSANILADVPYTDTGKFNFIQIGIVLIILPKIFSNSFLAPKDFHLPDGCSADEAIIACLARIRENIKLNSAKIIFTDPSANIFGHTHPNGIETIFLFIILYKLIFLEEVGAVQMGRFVSLVAMKRNSDKSGFPTEKLGRQICHHIIGMVPERLGEPPVPGTSQKEKTAEETKKQTFEEGEEHEDEEDHSSEVFTE
jgi:translation elongation factor EF-Ts